MAKFIYVGDISDQLTMENVRDIIVLARKIRGLTQKQLGDLVGVSAAQICKIEKSYDNVTLSTLTNIFLALGIKTELSIKPNENNTIQPGEDSSISAEGSH